jgi:Kelch motif protein
MRATIAASALLALLPARAIAQFDPTVPLPAKVVSAFLPVLDLDGLAHSSLPEGRVFHTTTTWTEDAELGTLDNPVGVLPLQTRGFILVAGGATLCPNGFAQAVASAVAYGPFVNLLVTAFPSVQPGTMTTSRLFHTATLLTAPLPGSPPGSLLTDGRILITGGTSANPGLQNIVASAEVYDPTTQTFTAIGSMTAPRATHRAVWLLDGRVLIVGGVQANQNDPTCAQALPPPCVQPITTCTGLALASAEIFDPATNTFTATGSMATPRAIGHSATLLSDGRVLVAGGITHPVGGSLAAGVLQPALATTEIFDPASGTFSPGPNMITARANHTATRLFHVDAPSAVCQSSPSSCSTVSSIFPSRVLMAGGSGQAGLNEILADVRSSAETYVPATNSFSAEGSMAFPRSLAAAELLPTGKVLVAGGFVRSGAGTNTAEVFRPGEGPNALNSLIPAGPGTFVLTNFPMLGVRAAHTANLTPSIPGGTVVIIGGFTAGRLAPTAETYIP